MNKKSQSIFTIFFIDIFFLLIWFVWLGGFVNTLFNDIATTWGATGIEELLLRNMEFIVLLVFILANILTISAGSRR